MGLLDIIGRCRGVHLITSGIHGLGQALDGTPLSGRIPALEGQDHRDPRPVKLAVQKRQPMLQVF